MIQITFINYKMYTTYDNNTYVCNVRVFEG